MATSSRFPILGAPLVAAALAAIALGLAVPASPEPLMSPEGSGFRDAVEALFFGTGPLARIGDPGCDSTLERMRGWPRGSRVRVVAYGSLDAERQNAVKRTLRQVDEVFGSTMTAELQTRMDVPEPAGSPEGEIAVFAAELFRVPDLCGIPARNCQVVRYRSGEFFASRVILGTPFTEGSSTVVAHELGHAFGLCHIDPSRSGLDPGLSAMGHAAAPAWTALDISAIRRVYSAGLSPADHRQRFAAAGLIN